MTELGDRTSSSSRRLAHELKKLVGWGVNERKLRGLKIVLDLANVRRRAGSGCDDPAELALAAYELIYDAVDGMDDVDREVLRLLLALEPSARSSTSADARRAAALGILRRTDQRWHMSVATWRRDHEVRFLDRLARRMLAAPAPAATFQNGPAHVLGHGPDPREDYAMLDVATVYRFTTGRVPDCQETVRTLQALRSGVDRWREDVRYVANDGVRLEVAEGARLEQELPGDFHGYRFWNLLFPHQLREGQTHTLKVRKVIVNRNVEPEPYFTFQARWPVDVLKMRVEFAPGHLPKGVARISTPAFKFPETTVSDNAMTLAGGAVETTFVHLREGMAYGFSWEW